MHINSASKSQSAYAQEKEKLRTFFRNKIGH